MELFNYSAIVTKITDGDTISLNIDLGFGMWYCNQSIRLNGVDTPEKRTRDPLEKKCGYLATAKVTELCPVGSKVILNTHIDKKGKFGRILGVIIVEKDGEMININEFLIDNRYAVHYQGQSKLEVKQLHADNYQYLIENGEIVE